MGDALKILTWSMLKYDVKIHENNVRKRKLILFNTKWAEIIKTSMLGSLTLRMILKNTCVNYFTVVM